MAEDFPEDLHTRMLGAGARLKAAREEAGLSLADLSARTKIHERNIAAIEAGNFAALASRTYAVGFSRTLARVLGLNEQDIAAAVRADLGTVQSDGSDHASASFDPGDPSRLPSSRTAWLAAAGAFAIIIGGYFAWNSFYVPAADLPSPLASSPAPAPAAPVAAAQGPVEFTALADRVWVKFTDAAGNQLLQKELALGESYTVPAEVQGPVLRTARPDALQITIAGRLVPKLSDVQTTMTDVPVSAAALLARTAAPAAGPVAPASLAASQPAPAASASRSPAPPRQRGAPPLVPGPSEASLDPLPAMQPSTISE